MKDMDEVRRVIQPGVLTEDDEAAVMKPLLKDAASRHSNRDSVPAPGAAMPGLPGQVAGVAVCGPPSSPHSSLPKADAPAP